MKRTRVLIFSVLLATVGAVGSQDAVQDALKEALKRADAEAIAGAVQQMRRALGDQAGVPEVADAYRRPSEKASVLTPSEARRALGHQVRRMSGLVSWRVGMDPATLSVPLRAPASLLSCVVAMQRARLEGFAEALPLGREQAAFLLWAQQQAGAGCFPFPAAKHTSAAQAMKVGTRFLERVEAAGLWEQTVRQGWAFEDHGDGGLQFDNGEAGVAMLELYEWSGEERYLQSARQAADWASTRPLCPNWNYNSFSVHLLAKAHQVTGEARYLSAALEKALLGVIPGQLTEGPRAGRWMDPHNARPAYHYLMLSALTVLASELPVEHPQRPVVVGALQRGLLARNREIVAMGVMNKDKAMQCLLLVNRLFAGDETFLALTQSREALEVLLRLVSEEARAGKVPLDPGGWGATLEWLVGAGKSGP